MSREVNSIAYLHILDVIGYRCCWWDECNIIFFDARFGIDFYLWFDKNQTYRHFDLNIFFEVSQLASSIIESENLDAVFSLTANPYGFTGGIEIEITGHLCYRLVSSFFQGAIRIDGEYCKLICGYPVGTDQPPPIGRNMNIGTRLAFSSRGIGNRCLNQLKLSILNPENINRSR